MRHVGARLRSSSIRPCATSPSLRGLLRGPRPVRLQRSLARAPKPVSVICRTGLRMSKTEIEKTRAETGVQNAPLWHQRAPVCRAETQATDSNLRKCGAFSAVCGLAGWGGRIRTSMCRENIHLFEKSPKFVIAWPSGDGCAFRENNLLCGAGLLTVRTRLRRAAHPAARSFSMSEFESSQGGRVAYCDMAQVSRSAKCSRMLRRYKAW
jgi:hypothetical protein